MEVLLTLTTLTTLTIVLLILGRKYKISLSQNKGLIFWSLSCVALVIGFIYYVYTPPATRIGVEQPISFSHQVHAGVKNIQCRFCHPYVDRSISPGIPPVEKCLYCHNYIIAKHPEILKVHRYYNTRTPTPWKRPTTWPSMCFSTISGTLKKRFNARNVTVQLKPWTEFAGGIFIWSFAFNAIARKRPTWDVGWHAIVDRMGESVNR